MPFKNVYKLMFQQPSRNNLSNQHPYSFLPPQQRLPLQVTEKNMKITVTSSNTQDPVKLELKLKHGAFLITNPHKKQLCITTFTSKYGNKIHVSFNDDQLVFGLGETPGPMNKQGKTLTMWNLDNPSYELDSTPLYQSLPVITYHDHNGTVFGIIIDHPGYSKYTFSKNGRVSEYHVKTTTVFSMYILTGPTLPRLMEQVFNILGSPLTISKWAFGYQQSRWSYSPKETVLQLAKTFREKQIPCDALYLDIDYMDNYKCFTWGKHFKPQTSFLTELHKLGYKVIAIIDPGIKIEPNYVIYEEAKKNGYFLKQKNQKDYETKVWAGPSHFPDFLNAHVQQWWANHVEHFAKDGLDGIWCDMNEPSTFDARGTFPPTLQHQLSISPTTTITCNHIDVHNAYGMEMAKATYMGLKRLTNNPFVLTRSSYLGGQRYSITWTGDNKSSWDHFQNTISMLLTLSLSGQPISGPDIGGFRGHATPILFKRWIQEAVFYPFMRNHTAYATQDQEPWQFGKEIEQASKQAIQTRYTLIPYLYSEYLHAIHAKQPLLRPLFYEHVNDYTLNPAYYETQAYFGRALLFAPYHTPEPTRTVYLPPGAWVSWWTKKRYDGNQVIQVHEHTDPIPFFIKEKTIIPLYPHNPQYIPNEEPATLSLLVVVPQEQAFQLQYDYHENSKETTLTTYTITLMKNNNTMTLHVTKPAPPYTTRITDLTIILNASITQVQVHPNKTVQAHIKTRLETQDTPWTTLIIKASPALPLPLTITLTI